MNWNGFEDVAKTVVKFMDRVVGWLMYITGGADDPYSYEGFYNTFWGDKHPEDAVQG